MTTNNNKQQAQPQAGPIAQQLAKIQANGQQAQFNGQQPLAGQPQKRTPNRTGFATKTLWDWLNLSGVLAIPVVVALASILLSTQQSQTSFIISTDQQQQEALNTYLDHMSNLLLSEHLKDSNPGSEVQVVAHALTMATARRLDPVRKGILLQFLYEADLITRGYSKVPLRLVDLSEVSLPGINLQGADLSGAGFKNADLRSVNLQGSDLNRTDLRGANLQRANLQGANVTNEQLSTAKSLQGATMLDGTVHP